MVFVFTINSKIKIRYIHLANNAFGTWHFTFPTISNEQDNGASIRRRLDFSFAYWEILVSLKTLCWILMQSTN